MAQETHINVGGSWEQARESYVKVGGTWRFVDAIWVKEAGVWELAYVDFGLSKSGDATAFDTTATNSVDITTVGGGLPYGTPSWSRISGDTEPQINNPSGTTVNWSVPSTGNYTATWRCTRSDAYGQVRTVDVNVTFTDTS